jgi:hypothetical protein
MAKLISKYIADGAITEPKLDISNAATDGYILSYNSSSGQFEWVTQTTDSKDFKVSANDSTAGFLEGKLIGTTGLVTLTTNNDGGNETLQISVGSNVFNMASNDTDDIDEGSSNLYFTNSRADARITAQKGSASGLCPLNSSSKIDTTYLPSLAISSTYVVASQTAQLALTVEEGDIAVRTDLNKSYIALNSDNADMGDWQELLAPTDAVSSVNGETGVVVLDASDVGAVATTGNETVAGVKTFSSIPILPASDPTSDNQAVRKSYVDDAVGSGVETRKTELLTLTSTNITNKYVTLSQTPKTVSAVSVCPVGGIPQQYGVDYTVSGTTLSWSSLGLEDILEATDILIVEYSY